jgi:hypothetical protein
MATSKVNNKASETTVKIDHNLEFVKVLITGKDNAESMRIGGKDKPALRQAPRAGQRAKGTPFGMPHGSVIIDSDGNVTTDSKRKDKVRTDKANLGIRATEASIHDLDDMSEETMDRRLLEFADILRATGLPVGDGIYGLEALIAIGKQSAEFKTWLASEVLGFRVGSIEFDKESGELKTPSIEIKKFDPDAWAKWAIEYKRLVGETFGIEIPTRAPAAKGNASKVSNSEMNSLYGGRTGKGGKTQNRTIPAPEDGFDPTAALRNKRQASAPTLTFSGKASDDPNANKAASNTGKASGKPPARPNASKSANVPKKGKASGKGKTGGKK